VHFNNKKQSDTLLAKMPQVFCLHCFVCTEASCHNDAFYIILFINFFYLLTWKIYDHHPRTKLHELTTL